MNKEKLWNIFPKTVTKKQASDSGMAAVLILLLIGFFTKTVVFYKLTIPVLIITMSVPRLFYPWAVLWFGLTEMLGTIVSKIILTMVYVVLIVPVGFIRKLLGKDALQLSKFKNGTGSVMKLRDYTFTSKDIEHPF